MLDSSKKEKILSVLVIVSLGAVAAVVIHYSMFGGLFVGTVNGKVHSLYERPIGAGRGGVSKMPKAIVLTESGEQLNIFCEADCVQDEKVKVNIYKPLFSEEMVYVFKGT